MKPLPAKTTDPQIFRVVLTLSIALLLLIFIVGIIFYIQRVEKRVNTQYVQNALLENQLNDLLSNLQDAETGQRGYLLTFNDSYLAPYYSAVNSNEPLFEEITQNLVSSHHDAVLLTTLKQLIDDKLAELEQTIILSKSGRHDEAIALVNTDIGKQYMDSIRRVIKALRETEKMELDENLQSFDRIHNISNGVIIGFGLILMGLLFYIWGVIRPLFVKLDEVNMALQKNNKLIASKNQQIKQFAYITSHDLKEPVRTITSFIQLLERRYSNLFDKNAREYFDFIKDANQRMEQMISSILDYSKLGRDRAYTEVDMNETLEVIKKDLGFSIQKSKAIINHTKLPLLYGSGTEIRQLFQNLISNAIKFKKPDTPPIIEITSNEDNRYWHFAIADNGIGIPKDKLKKVFGFFTKLHAPDEFEGQGIGLAFCKKIVESHGGNINIESDPGQGSVFKFSISKPLTTG